MKTKQKESKGATRSFLDLFRAAREVKTQTAADIWWQTAGDLAADRQPRHSPEAVADAGEKLGRGLADLEREAALIRELGVAEERGAVLEQARARQKAAAVARGEAVQRATDLRNQGNLLVLEADASVSEAANDVRLAQEGIENARRVRRQLAAVGHPGSVAELQHSHDAGEVDRLRAELSSLDRGTHHSSTSPHTRRAEIRARLAELGEDVDTDTGVARTRPTTTMPDPFRVDAKMRRQAVPSLSNDTTDDLVDEVTR